METVFQNGPTACLSVCQNVSVIEKVSSIDAAI